MKHFHSILLGLLIIGYQANAQNADSTSQKEDKEKVTVRIVKEKNGKKTIIDTTYYTDDNGSLQKKFEDREIEMIISGDKRRIILHKQGKEDSEMEKEIRRDGIPPPLPPLPPLPPSSDKGPGSDEMNFYSYHYSDDFPDVDLEEIDEILDRNMNVSGRNDKIVRIFETDKNNSKRRKKSKNVKRRIIVIEEM